MSVSSVFAVLPPDLGAQGQPRDVGQHHVQHRQVDLLASDQGQGVGAGAAGEDLEALAPEVYRDQVGDLLLVVHHQDALVHGSFLPIFAEND